MKEQAVTIGEQPKLVGVYTDAEQHNGLPTIILFNSGLLPHIGPFRLYVRLARNFAKLGFNCFRFDLSGIGDSERHTDNRQHNERHEGDIADVLDHLEKQNMGNKFIVMGICTGADNAHKTMKSDPRVVGAVSIDGYSYPTLRYYFNLYAYKLFSISSWVTLTKMVFKKASYLFKIKKPEESKSLEYGWVKPTVEQIESDYKSFIKRDASMLCIYTASWPYNYENQLADVFKSIQFGEHIQTAYLEDAEHIFPLAEDRKVLTETITNWLDKRFLNNIA